jgi:ABC-type lipoprotein export system ATPase subunit
LLHLISLAENIALGPCYYQGCTEAEALAPHADLLKELELEAHLTQNPTQVSRVIYGRAVWARELIKGPELILAAISGEFATTAGAAMLANVLREYRTRYGAAALLLGDSLEAFYPLGHRLLLLENRQLQKQTILEHRARPLTAYLPLV